MPRWAAVAGLLLGVLAVAVLGGTVGLLRHPAPAPPQAPEPPADPREDEGCPAEPLLPRAPDAPPLPVDSNLLYECPSEFDGARVLYRGEAVGAILPRRAGVWLQLNDDVYAEDLGPLPAHQDFRGGNAGVGVLAPASVAGQIAFVGGPTAHGDIVEVTGTFERVDPESGEVAVIRADSARVVRRGAPLERPALRDRQVAAYGAVLMALALTVVERLLARRRRVA